MIRFEKVSFEQFKKDYDMVCKNKINTDQLKLMYDNIKLPARSSIGSAGYDFYSPFSFTLNTKPFNENDASIIIPTGIRCKMDDDKVLMLYPRSGLGFKTGVSLANTTGVIDASYYGSSNEGHIMAKMVNGFKDLYVEAGDRFMQGVFLQYFVTDDDNTTAIRNGGFGSSGE